MVRRPNDVARRGFLTGMAALGMGVLLGRVDTEAQMPATKPHRIDVHHHHTPPPYLVGIPRRAAAIIVDNDSPRPPCMTTSDGLFCLCRPGTNGFCFRLEVSTNLVNWVPVCTNSVTDGAIHYVDPDATDSVIRFYRTSPAPCPPAD